MRKLAEQVQKLEAESKAGATAATKASASVAASAAAGPTKEGLALRPVRRTVEAVRAYAAADADELSLQAGDKVDVLLDNVAAGWSVGRNRRGETGLVPLAHVAPSSSA